MDVLILGSDNPVGSALLSAFTQWGRHRGIGLSSSSCRWRSERQAKKACRKNRPQAVVDLRLGWQVASGEVMQPADIERTHWVAKACARSAMHYLFLSSDQVFAGQTGRHLIESDETDAFQQPGLQLIEAEDQILQVSQSSLVLRTGPVFASFNDNMLTRIVEDLLALPRTIQKSGGDAYPSANEGKQVDALRVSDTDGSGGLSRREVVLDNDSVFCPVASVDLARVLAAMLDQLSVGSQARGIFHYASAERTTEYAFAETVLASVNQFAETGNTTIAASPNHESKIVQSRVLSCSRVLSSFAIQQVPWREFIQTFVKQCIESNQQYTSRGAGSDGGSQAGMLSA
ncbi:MAG: sugar nucleotide-binding protein [Pseudomonadota bacterium]